MFSWSVASGEQRRRSFSDMTTKEATTLLIDRFRERRPIRTGSFIVTVFGDSISPRGGTVWLGSLISALANFDINQRLVRTSVFRLAREGWLTARQKGRRSYYSLTVEGRERFALATRRIYGEPHADWSGEWCLVILPQLDSGERERIRKDLGWLGFGAFSGNLLALPITDLGQLRKQLAELGHLDKVVVMSATTPDGRYGEALQRLVHDSWGLAELENRYVAFIDEFQPVLDHLQRTVGVDPQTAFQVRTLLIHEYRKILLRDPWLPAELLPDNWHGTVAYHLCRDLYRAVYREAEEYLGDDMETADGPLPPSAPHFYQRFGGLA
jgi:phenylacetic acid degradation operon negative regulatory protein